MARDLACKEFILIGSRTLDRSIGMWGPSATMPAYQSNGRGMNIDGSAASAMYRFNGNLSQLEFLQYDITNLAYSCGAIRARVCSICSVCPGCFQIDRQIFARNGNVSRSRRHTKLKFAFKCLEGASMSGACSASSGAVFSS
jgi:hypothetical protein